MIAPAAHTIDATPQSGRLRILYLIDSLGSGGAEHLLAAYLRHLPALGARGLRRHRQDHRQTGPRPGPHPVGVLKHPGRPGSLTP